MKTKMNQNKKKTQTVLRYVTHGEFDKKFCCIRTERMQIFKAKKKIDTHSHTQQPEAESEWMQASETKKMLE